jgi:hypothetical protein
MNMEHEVWSDWQCVIPACYQYCSEWATNVFLTRWKREGVFYLKLNCCRSFKSLVGEGLVKLPLEWIDGCQLKYYWIKSCQRGESQSVEEYQLRFNGCLKKDLLPCFNGTLDLGRAMVTSGQGILWWSWTLILKWNEVFRVAVLFDESLGIKMCLTSDYISCEECH